MRKSFLLFLVLASLISADGPNSDKAPQFLWPIQNVELSGLLTSTFGESRKDHFHNGLDISSVLQPVKAMADGELLYSRYAEDDPFEEERGSGNIVWISHQDGYVSGYYHLHGSRNEIVRSKQPIKAGDTIGISGNTGHSTGGHLHFVLGKSFGKTLLDPLQYLPPIEDKMEPNVANLFIHVGESYTNLNDGDNINVSKAFPLTVAIFDGGIKNSQRRGIRQVEYQFNGEKIKKASFDSLEFREGQWLTKEGYNFDSLFFKDRYLVGELNLKAGENTIKVKASDFSGLSSEKQFTINVTRISGKD